MFTKKPAIQCLFDQVHIPSGLVDSYEIIQENIFSTFCENHNSSLLCIFFKNTSKALYNWIDKINYISIPILIANESYDSIELFIKKFNFDDFYIGPFSSFLLNERINKLLNFNQDLNVYYLAYYDNLTGILSRSSIESLIQEKCNRLQSFSIFYIDLNNFKKINDVYGHEAGDCLLKQVSIRLQQLIDHNDKVARFGGDEFCIVFDNNYSKKELDEILYNILFKLSSPYHFKHNVLSIEVSVGISTYPDNGNKISDLLSYADKMMYQQKRHKKFASSF